MAKNGYSEDKCIVCGLNLRFNHKTDYCREHYIEKINRDKINKWLETGDTSCGTNTTLRNVIRQYIYNKQNEKCAICEINSFWNGKILKFVLDHIDGDAANNYEENLRLICPNCDSQLQTYKSKNKKSARLNRYVPRKSYKTKSIKQINAVTNAIINTFNSAKEAADYLNGNESSIHNAANGSSKTSSGFIWSYD